MVIANAMNACGTTSKFLKKVLLDANNNRREKNMELFAKLLEYKLIDEYAKVFDWVLDENKFPKSVWDNKNKISAFTKAIHRLDNLKKENIHYDAKKRLEFPSRSEIIPCVYMSNGSSEGRDWLRHIRNGIAHGRVEVLHNTSACKSGLVLEILDFGKKDDGSVGQTAYILIPLEYLSELYRVYCTKEKQWKKERYKNPRR